MCLCFLLKNQPIFHTVVQQTPKGQGSWPPVLVGRCPAGGLAVGRRRGRRGWPLRSKAAYARTVSEDAAPARPGVPWDPRKVCSSPLAPLEGSALKTCAGCVSVCAVSFFFFSFP